MYAYPVTLLSACVCALASWVLEGSTDVLGWLHTPRLLVMQTAALLLCRAAAAAAAAAADVAAAAVAAVKRECAA